MSRKLRIWRLGDLEQKMFPTQECVDKLAQIIADQLQKGDGDLDIVWGPDISVQQVDLDTNDVNIILPTEAEVSLEEGDGAISVGTKTHRIIIPRSKT